MSPFLRQSQPEEDWGITGSEPELFPEQTGNRIGMYWE